MTKIHHKQTAELFKRFSGLLDANNLEGFQKGDQEAVSALDEAEGV